MLIGACSECEFSKDLFSLEQKEQNSWKLATRAMPRFCNASFDGMCGHPFADGVGLALMKAPFAAGIAPFSTCKMVWLALRQLNVTTPVEIGRVSLAVICAQCETRSGIRIVARNKTAFCF